MREGKEQKGDCSPNLSSSCLYLKLFHSILTQKNGFHAGTENATSASTVSKYSILLRADKENKCVTNTRGQNLW